uniref:Caleosin n=1 Tax=Panagrolaimus sp. PS1159 TaxID=55785 RepID=A0AC35GNT4_9BILA
MDKTPLQQCPEKTALQKHCEFFDQNKDGAIMPWETYKGFRDLGFGFITSTLSAFTYKGFRDLGFGFITSTLSAFVINLFLSYPTQDSKIPNPLLPIYIKNVHRGKHTSDSDTYDTDGTINPKKFEQFQKLIRECTNGKDVITTLSEALKLSELFRQGFDPVGGTASKGEWVFLWLANDYKLDAKDIQASYDG